MEKITLGTLKKLLPHYWKIRKPLYLWGKPSSGKTSILRQFAQEKAKELGLLYSEDEFGDNIFTFKVITLSQFDSADLRGMPKVENPDSSKKAVTKFIATAELPREGQGIIHFDEFNKASEDLQAPAYQYVLEGRLTNIPPLKDEKGLDKFWRTAAANNERDFCEVHRTSLALLSRFKHFEIELTIDDFVPYLLAREADPRIIGYLKNMPQDLFPKVWDERLLETKANPFPRQWEDASQLIKGVKDLEIIRLLVASCVGPEVASRFLAFCKTSNKINIPKIIQSPQSELAKLKENADKASLLWAVISSLASLWYKNDKKLTAQKVVKIAQAMVDEKLPDFSVAFLKMVLKKKSSQLTVLAEIEPLLDKLGIYIDE